MVEVVSEALQRDASLTRVQLSVVSEAGANTPRTRTPSSLRAATPLCTHCSRSLRTHRQPRSFSNQPPPSLAGASVLSVSESAAAAEPGLDVGARGAASIGRRLQDPLAELVKMIADSHGDRVEWDAVGWDAMRCDQASIVW